jgi:hypothetical protein
VKKHVFGLRSSFFVFYPATFDAEGRTYVVSASITSSISSYRPP